MFQQIRKIFTLILFGLIVVAFALWGINDVFRGIGAQNVAEVGGEKITPAQLSRELELTLRAQRQDGRNISQAEAVEQGVHLRLLESMIARRAIVHYAQQLGVSASDAQVANRIRQIPAVLNPLSGTFDQTAYQQFLNEYRYTQSEFEHEMRGDLTSEMLRTALTAGVRAPSSYGALVLAYETEQRTISVAEAPMSLANDVPQPTEAQLRDFYEDSRAQLAVPEYRALTLVYARAADFAARVDVPETRLHEEFEARRAALSQPERRSYIRIAATSEQQAQDAVARLNRGEAPNAVAQALGAQLTRGENQTREQVIDDTVAAAVFSAAAGQARAVQASLSPWAVVRVDSITPAQAPDFAAARDTLRQEIALDEAGDLLNAAIGAFEDARAGGAAVAQAAATAGLRVETVPAVDAQGRDPQGEPVAALAEQQDILGTAFETQEGEASDFLPFGDADVVIAVDRITPATTRPFDEVRAQLQASWLVRERARRLQALGEEVAAAVREGQSFAAAARARRMNVVVASRPLDRRSAAQLPARQLAAMIFAAGQGDVVSDLRVDGGALIVAHVETITRPNPAESPQLLESARGQMQQTLAQSLDQAVTAEAVTRARPRRNEQVIQRLFNAGGEGEDGVTP